MTMDLSTVFLMILLIVFVDADCTGGVETCENTYNINKNAHFLLSNALCNDLEDYVKCVFRQGCDIGTGQKQYMIESTKNSRELFNCPFTMTDLINHGTLGYKGYGNSASVLSPINITLIMIMSFVLLIMN